MLPLWSRPWPASRRGLTPACSRATSAEGGGRDRGTDGEADRTARGCARPQDHQHARCSRRLGRRGRRVRARAAGRDWTATSLADRADRGRSGLFLAGTRSWYARCRQRRPPSEGLARLGGVPSATVYRLFSSKPGILKALLDVSIAGDDEAVPLQNRPHARALFDDPDPRNQLSGFAGITAGIMSRAEPVYRILVSAAGSDPGAAALLAEQARQRDQGQEQIALSLARAGALRPGLRERDAADIIHALMSPEVYRLLVTHPDYPGARLVACKNPLLQADRARTRESLLAATEADLAKITAATRRARRPLRGQDKIALRIGRILNWRKSPGTSPSPPSASPMANTTVAPSPSPIFTANGSTENPPWAA